MTFRADEQAKIAERWWRRMQPGAEDGARNRGADRAALARLRRADLRAAMSDPATFTLFHDLRRRRPEDLPEVALCAAVLAGVREDRPGEHPARTLGPPGFDNVEQAAMKPLRFRRLIEAEAPEDRLILLRRAVQLADRRLNVAQLAAACLDWSEHRRQCWIFEYYGAGRAAPDIPTELAEEPVA
jgi:CRISPR system Cascade subunit CasB